MKLLFSILIVSLVLNAQNRGSVDFPIFDFNDKNAKINISNGDFEDFQKDLYSEFDIGSPNKIYKLNKLPYTKLKMFMGDYFVKLKPSSYPVLFFINGFNFQKDDVADNPLIYYSNLFQYSNNDHGIIFVLNHNSVTTSKPELLKADDTLKPGKSIFHLSVSNDDFDELFEFIIDQIEEAIENNETLFSSKINYDINNDKQISFYETMLGLSKALKIKFKDKFTIYNVKSIDDTSYMVNKL